MWCVRRWPAHRAIGAPARAPPTSCGASPPVARVLREPGSPGRRCGCSGSLYLAPTAPTRGPCEKQTPRGLEEETGERFSSPCHGCCCCSRNPRDWGACHSRPARSGYSVWFCSRVAGAGARGSPALPSRSPGLVPGEFFRGEIRH